MEMKKKKSELREMQRFLSSQMCSRPHSDVLGSYTGMGEFGEYPEQDADDL